MDEPKVTVSPDDILEALDPTQEAQEREKRKTRTYTRRGTSRKTKIDVTLFAQQLQGAHKIGALMVHEPLLEIEAEESKQFAKAIADIVEEYGFNASRRSIMWGNLIAVATMIYGPRFMMIRSQRAARKPAQIQKTTTKEKKTEAPSGFKMDFSSLG